MRTFSEAEIGESLNFIILELTELNDWKSSICGLDLQSAIALLMKLESKLEESQIVARFEDRDYEELAKAA